MIFDLLNDVFSTERGKKSENAVPWFGLLFVWMLYWVSRRNGRQYPSVNNCDLDVCVGTEVITAAAV
jgi:hypothetical protein